MNKSLNCVEWKHGSLDQSNQLVAGGNGGALYLLTRNVMTVADPNQGDFDHELATPQAHSDHIRDLKICPSLFTEDVLLASAGDDKKIAIWIWKSEGLELHQTIEVGRAITRLAWNLTGKYLFAASADGPLSFVLDKEAQTLSLVNN